MIASRPGRGLRSSVTYAFAFGALALSTVLALGTYFSARHFLLEQRERTALRQAFTDSALVRDSLLTSGTEVSDVLGAISPPAGAVIYVRRHGEWYSSALDTAGPEMTTEVQPVVTAGSVGIGWTDATDPHAVVVGIPLPAVDAQYYEVSVAEELDRTLWTLALALAVCAGLTTVAGAVLGRGASRRVLTPSERGHDGGHQAVGRRPDDPPPQHRRSGPGRAGRFFQPHGRRAARPDRTGRPLRRRCRPRATDTGDDVDHQPQPPAAVHRPVTSLGHGGAADGRGAGAVSTGAGRSPDPGTAGRRRP